MLTVVYVLVLDQTVNENDQTFANNEQLDLDGGDAYVPDDDAGNEPLVETKVDEIPEIDLNVSLDQEFATQDSMTFTENHRYNYSSHNNYVIFT